MMLSLSLVRSITDVKPIILHVADRNFFFLVAGRRLRYSIKIMARSILTGISQGRRTYEKSFKSRPASWGELRWLFTTEFLAIGTYHGK